MELAVKEWVFNSELHGRLVQITGYSPENEHDFDQDDMMIKDVSGDKITAVSTRNTKVWRFFLYEFSEGLNISIYGQPEPLLFKEED
ncbi:hypothetical protein [Paenibacillus sp. FSL R5-0810]|uniref:hypothetical protein n=1 Tax=Paenibacillus sp. FSL R5-0810 TaxID=2921659 RepID=UPI0030F527F7